MIDPAAAHDGSRQWFDSKETAARALAAKCAEAIVKLLSEENLAMLHLIENRQPGSVRELVALAGRKESNLSRTLKKLEEIGIVGCEDGAGRARAPRLLARPRRAAVRDCRRRSRKVPPCERRR